MSSLLRLAAATVALVAAASCTGAEATRPTPTEERAMQLKPTPDWPVVHGPATDDADALARWLAAQQDFDGRPATVRLPLHLALGPARASVKDAHVVARGADGLALRVSDAALGISLAERVRQAFPDADDGALWLEGQWRGDHLFVTRALGPVGGGDAVQYARRAVPGARADLVALLERLGSDAPLEERRDAAEALKAGGVDSIPLLIASLGDGRPFEVRDAANRMNLPPNATVEPMLVTTRVGTRCEDLLHAIITPAVPSPPAGHFKVFSTEVLHVADWTAFWAKRRGKTLAELHDELAPYARAYWEAHGTTQAVP